MRNRNNLLQDQGRWVIQSNRDEKSSGWLDLDHVTEWDGDLLNSHYGCEDTYDTYVSTIITPRSSDIDLDTPDANKCSKAKASDIKYNTTSDETAKYNVKACKCDESDKCNSADRSLAGLTALVAATVFSRLF